MSQLSVQNPADYYGQKILAAEISDTQLLLSLENKKQISIWDSGQSCCESRWMSTDDEIQSLVGHELRRIESKDGPDEEGEYHGDYHEQVFIEVGTDAGFITIVNHNRHNGYYGGFGLTVTEVTA